MFVQTPVYGLCPHTLNGRPTQPERDKAQDQRDVLFETQMGNTAEHPDFGLIMVTFRKYDV